MAEIKINVVTTEISKNYIENIFSKQNGGNVQFFGTIKNTHREKIVGSIKYFIFKDLMVAVIKKKYFEYSKGSDINMFIVQREGIVKVGEVNLVVGVSSKSRREAFLYCNDIIEFLKTEIPIWKKEFYVDGSYKWINV